MRLIVDLNLAGTEISRRTCRILIPGLRSTLKIDRSKSSDEALRLFFQHIKLLTGFATVAIHLDLSLSEPKRELGYVEGRARMLRDVIEVSKPALGPAIPCDSVRDRYDVNFKFSPRRFVAKRLARAKLGIGYEEPRRDQ